MDQCMKNTLILITLLVSGCTALGVPVTEFEAKQYSKIETFIAGNFSRGPDIIGATDNEDLLINGVLWKAKFNEMNQTYLDKPHQDLITYCEAKGGKLSNIPTADVKLATQIDTKQLDILQVANDAQERFRARFGKHWTEAIVTLNAIKSAIYHNQVMSNDAVFTYDTLNFAYKSGKLGYFTCSLQNNAAWLATIQVESVDIGSRDKNLMKMPNAMLRIVGRTIPN